MDIMHLVSPTTPSSESDSQGTGLYEHTHFSHIQYVHMFRFTDTTGCMLAHSFLHVYRHCFSIYGCVALSLSS